MYCKKFLYIVCVLCYIHIYYICNLKRIYLKNATTKPAQLMSIHSWLPLYMVQGQLLSVAVVSLSSQVLLNLSTGPWMSDLYILVMQCL